MNKEFKKLLIKIARLPRSDQRWILKQLNPTQREQFKKLQGNSLLLDAYRFRSLSDSQLEKMDPDSPLPKSYQTLRKKDPLFIALILEQGQFSWADEFLKEIEINEETYKQVKLIKPATKLFVYQQWQSELCDLKQPSSEKEEKKFDEYLEIAHG